MIYNIYSNIYRYDFKYTQSNLWNALLIFNSSLRYASKWKTLSVFWGIAKNTVKKLFYQGLCLCHCIFSKYFSSKEYWTKERLLNW